MGRAITLVGVLACAAPTRADIPPDYDFQWANISDLNNPAYGGPGGNAGRGSVDHKYRIAKLEITTQQWADFLNMALRQGASLDQYDLKPNFWGATKAANSYVVTAPMRPVLGLNWRAGAYYCNWLNNGKQENWNSCLNGAYDTSTFSGNPGSPYTDQLTHSPNAKFWIPTLDEYLKAAHYDPAKGGQGGWWDYTYRSDSPPIPGAPGVGQTTGGWEPGGLAELGVDLGAYTNFTSAYGLWDLSGGSREWIEDAAAFDSSSGLPYWRRVFGSYAGDRTYLDSDRVKSNKGEYPASDGFNGFRIAGQIPAPSVTAAFVGSAGLFLFRRRR